MQSTAYINLIVQTLVPWIHKNGRSHRTLIWPGIPLGGASAGSKGRYITPCSSSLAFERCRSAGGHFFFFTILTDGFVLQNILSLKTKTTEPNSISLSMPEWVFRWKGLPVIKKKNHACIFTSL